MNLRERCAAIDSKREGGGQSSDGVVEDFAKNLRRVVYQRPLAVEWIVGPEPPEIGVNSGEAHALAPGN